MGTDPDFLIQCLKKVGEIKKECGLEDTAVYVSAWNNTISNRSLLNDTVYKGSYIIKNAIDSMKNGPEILGLLRHVFGLYGFQICSVRGSRAFVPGWNYEAGGLCVSFSEKNERKADLQGDKLCCYRRRE